MFPCDDIIMSHWHHYSLSWHEYCTYSQQVPMVLPCTMNWKMILSKLPPHVPGANELNHYDKYNVILLFCRFSLLAVRWSAWCHFDCDLYLNQLVFYSIWWVASLEIFLLHGITRPQWVKRSSGVGTSALSGTLYQALTHWGRDKMAAISQTIFSNAFSWMEMYEFRLIFHWGLFLGVQLTIFQHWFR